MLGTLVICENFVCVLLYERKRVVSRKKLISTHVFLLESKRYIFKKFYIRSLQSTTSPRYNYILINMKPNIHYRFTINIVDMIDSNSLLNTKHLFTNQTKSPNHSQFQRFTKSFSYLSKKHIQTSHTRAHMIKRRPETND